MAPLLHEAVTTPQALDLTFELSALRKGTVKVSVQPNQDPEGYGCDLLLPDKPKDAFATFPVCEATVRSTGAKGYGAIYGWVQLVLSDESAVTRAGKWEMDPIPITENLNTPFCWFGPEPSLFDCPMRSGVQEMDWTCHSFLTYIPDCLISKDVRIILGFQWGFWIRDGQVHVKRLEKLPSTAWDEHLDMLREKHPSWTFRPSESDSS